MPNSTTSLDSLSSPSPSPPPSHGVVHPGRDPATVALDSDSELSELTEEEQEAEKHDNAQGEDDDDNDDGERQQRPRRGRRKRGSIVPAPMWGWATRATVEEEEEEEEMAGPPRAMEEEEDEGDDDSVTGARRIRSRANEDDDDDDDDDSLDPEDAESAPLRNGADEDESGSDGEDPPRNTSRVRRSARGPLTASFHEPNGGEAAYPASTPRQPETYDSEDEDEELSDPPPGQPDDANDSDNDNDTESDDQDRKEREAEMLYIVSPTAAIMSLKPTSAPTLADMDIDVTAPSPQAMAPLAAAAAASSIMAGSTVLRPPSPSPSSPSSNSSTSSRSPSPVLGCPPGNGSGLPGGEVATSRSKHDKKPKQISTDKRAEMSAPTPSKVVNISPKTARDRANVEIAELDGEAEDVEVDDPSPDHDLELELESDLQPAHRAEALDVLATIELKFALLRERVYVEKMDALAWEEALVGEGTHPELIHLHAELLKRRDKRLDLAMRKRSYEVTMATKRRRVDETATWNRWKFSRDELQTDMISETNRKRRRLERERRAMERPQPVRRIPRPQYDLPIPPTLRRIVKAFPFASKTHTKRDSYPPNHSLLVYPELSPLSSHDIDIDLQFLHSHRRTSADMHRMGTNGINIHAPPSYDPYMNGGSGLDGLGPLPAFGPGNRMPPPPPFHHPPPLMQGAQQMTAGFPSFGGPGPGRLNHQSHPPPSSLSLHHNHNPHPHFMEQDMGPLASGPGLGPSHLHSNQHPPYFGSAQGGTGQIGPGYPIQGGHMETRRSISPVPLLVNGPGGSSAPPMAGGKQNGGWVGMTRFHHGIKHSGTVGEWVGEGRNMSEMDDEERARESRREREGVRERSEREREREQHETERDRERDRERSYHMPHFIPQSHRPHPHLHAPTGQLPHHHVGPHHHHHHHHHHILHHHHGQQPPTAGVSTGHPASAPLPSVGPSLSPHVMTSRDFETGRPHSGHARPTEVISLLSSKPGIPHWKADDAHHSSSADYREPRGKHSRPSSGPPAIEDRERPLAMPFVMTSTHSIPPSLPPPAPGPGSSSLPRSPRGSWGAPDDSSFRRPPSSGSAPVGYLGSAESHGNSPAPLRYPPPSSSGHLGRGPPPVSRQNSIGLSPPHARPLPPPSPSSSSYPGSQRSPTRFGPPPPSGPLPPLSHALSSPKHQPISPALSKVAISGASSVFSPRLSGPVHISTPTSLGSPLDLKGSTTVGFAVSRTGSPHMFPSPSTHPTLPPPRPSLASNGSAASPRLPPVLPAPKMNIAQMVDGH